MWPKMLSFQKAKTDKRKAPISHEDGPLQHALPSIYTDHNRDILMKNKKAEHGQRGDETQAKQQELEIFKAVAQAWHGHSGSSRATTEFDARRLNFRAQPSRFRLEAMNRNKSSSLSKGYRCPGSGYWDFGQSLWDSYEILAVSRKLESGMVLDDPFSGDPTGRVIGRRRESKNSLRNLFNLVSSRRYNEPNVPYEQDSQF